MKTSPNLEFDRLAIPSNSMDGEPLAGSGFESQELDPDFSASWPEEGE